MPVAPVSLRTRLQVALAAGLGTGWAVIVYKSVLEVVEKGAIATISLVCATALVSLLAWLFIEPAVRHAFGMGSHPESARFLSPGFLAAYASVFITGIVMEPITSTLQSEPRTWVQILIHISFAFAITFGWVIGVGRRRSRALVFGVLIGLFWSLILGAITNVAIHLFDIYPKEVRGNLSLMGILGGAVAYGVFGLLWALTGGAAIDFWRGPRPWIRILLALSGGSTIICAYWYWQWSFTRIPVAQFWYIVGTFYAVAVGWSLGIWVFRSGENALTRPSAASMAPTASALTLPRSDALAPSSEPRA